MKAPRARLLLVGAALLAIGGTAVLWWSLAPRDGGDLEPGWTASVGVIAGDGVAGWRDGHVSRARFADPFDAAIAADGTIVVSDAGASHRIRAISPEGEVRTLAGGGPGFADGPGTAARFDTPSGIAIDGNGIVYVADTGNNAIRRITPDGQVSTVAGDGAAGSRDGAGRQARFNGPLDVAVDAAGRVIVADTYNDRIRAIAPDGTVSTLAGAGMPGLSDGPATGALFDTPAGIACDGAGTIFVADTGNGTVRAIDDHGMVSTLVHEFPDGLVRPVGIAASGDGSVYVTDDRGRIAELDRRRMVRVLAGSTPGFREGDGTAARFRRPSGVAWWKPGHLIVADAGNAMVRLIAARSRMDVRVPASPLIAPGFDARSFSHRPLLWPVAPMDGPHEIAGTHGEARGAGGSERFHAGIDIRVPDGTTVLAVRDDAVVSAVATGEFGTLNEWLRIGPVAYVHIRAGRTPDGTVLDPDRFVPTYDETGRIVRIRAKRGARFATGEPVATVNSFNHVHLNVGWPGEEHNPLQFRLAQFEDTRPPTIARGGVRLYDQQGQPLTTRAGGRVLVAGRVQIVVDAWDQADGNRPGRRLGLYALGYQILHRDGTPAPGFETPLETIRFNQLALAPEAASLVYAPGSGIPYYGRRMTRFLYIVTNTFRDGIARPGYWDTTLLPPADYIVRALAADVRGNAALANRDVPVRVVRGE